MQNCFYFVRTSKPPENKQEKNPIMQLHLYFTHVNLKNSRWCNTSRTIWNSKSMLFLLKISMLCTRLWFQHIADELPCLPAPLINFPPLETVWGVLHLPGTLPPWSQCKESPLHSWRAAIQPSAWLSAPLLPARPQACILFQKPPEVLQQDYFWSSKRSDILLSLVLNIWGLTFFFSIKKNIEWPY